MHKLILVIYTVISLVIVYSLSLMELPAGAHLGVILILIVGWSAVYQHYLSQKGPDN